MKKLACIAPYKYLPYYSGGQKLIAQFCEFLGNNEQVELHVISSNNNDINLVKHYFLHPLLGNRALQRYVNPFLFFKVYSFLQKNKIETLIIEHPYHAWLAWLIKKTTSVKIILHTHNIEHLRFKSIGKWWWHLLKIYEGWFFKFADQVFLISEEDKQDAISIFNIPQSKCLVVPFGVTQCETPKNKELYKNKICSELDISPNDQLLLFPANFNYLPNTQALDLILNNINPLLLENDDYSYRIIITGKKLADSYNQLKAYKDLNILFLDFVENIDDYFLAADILLNPVLRGGGVKTKLIEAISFGTTVISTITGAIGADKEACENKLITIADNSWSEFTKAIMQNKNIVIPTLEKFYDTYYWGNIANFITNRI